MNRLSTEMRGTAQEIPETGNAVRDSACLLLGMVVVGLLVPGCSSTTNEAGGPAPDAVSDAGEDSAEDSALVSGDAAVDGADPSQCTLGPLTVTPAPSAPAIPAACATDRIEGRYLADPNVGVGTYCDELNVLLPDVASAPSVAALFPGTRCTVTADSPNCTTSCEVPHDPAAAGQTLDQTTFERLCAALEIDPGARVECLVIGP